MPVRPYLQMPQLLPHEAFDKLHHDSIAVAKQGRPTLLPDRACGESQL
jgi:hypothetical protein